MTATLQEAFEKAAASADRPARDDCGRRFGGNRSRGPLATIVRAVPRRLVAHLRRRHWPKTSQGRTLPMDRRTMTSRTTERFRKSFAKLPANVQDQANRDLLFGGESNHPSLQFKRDSRNRSDLCGQDRHSLASVGRRRDDRAVVWIDHHSEYDKLISHGDRPIRCRQSQSQQVFADAHDRRADHC